MPDRYGPSGIDGILQIGQFVRRRLTAVPLADIESRLSIFQRVISVRFLQNHSRLRWKLQR